MHLRPFEIALITIFSIAAIGGLIAVKLFEPDSQEANPYGENAVIWGTLDAQAVDAVLNEVKQNEKAMRVVTYIEKDPRTFDAEFVNAIAEGKAPDLVILPHTALITHRSKLYPIPYESFPERTFRDMYIDGADIFMLPDGIYGIPFAVDPLVLYWNRDLFSSAGLVSPPKTWEVFMNQTVPALVRKDDAFTLTQRAAAFGEFQNVTHAKEVISMLFLQAGNALVTTRIDGYRIVMNERAQSGLPASESVLSFYTQFASPGSAVYSWNRTQQLDRTQFLGGTLAMYFGFGSELTALRRDNPNLNFDVAMVPQGAGATVLRSYGTFYTLAIPLATAQRKFTSAYTLAQAFTGTHAQALTSALGLVPVMRTFHENQKDPSTAVFYSSALIARGWLDPNPRETAYIFETLIEEITSGQKRIGESVSDAVGSLEMLFK